MEQTVTEQATAIAIQRLHPEKGDILVMRGLDPGRAGKLAQCLQVQWSGLSYKVPVLIVPEGARVTLETIEMLQEEVRKGGR